MNRLRIFPVLYLFIFIIGCTKTVLVKEPVYEDIIIPYVLKEPCNISKLKDTTSREDIIKYTISLVYDIEKCNEKRKALIKLIEINNNLGLKSGEK